MKDEINIVINEIYFMRDLTIENVKYFKKYKTYPVFRNYSNNGHVIICELGIHRTFSFHSMFNYVKRTCVKHLIIEKI